MKSDILVAAQTQPRENGMGVKLKGMYKRDITADAGITKVNHLLIYTTDGMRLKAKPTYLLKKVQLRCLLKADVYSRHLLEADVCSRRLLETDVYSRRLLDADVCSRHLLEADIYSRLLLEANV